MKSGSVGAFTVGLAVLVALAIVFGSCYTVDQTQRPRGQLLYSSRGTVTTRKLEGCCFGYSKSPHADA